MAARRHSHQKVSKSHGVPRRTVSTSLSKRPALVALHQNAHLVTSMVRLTRSKSDLFSFDVVELGRKRKRATSVTRGGLKRRKSSPRLESEPDVADAPEKLSEDEIESLEEAGESGSEEDSSDDFLLRHAPKWRLLKLRKEDLVRLYRLAELDDDPEALNKAALVSRVLASRPPMTSHISDTSSNDAGAEEGDEDSDAQRPAPIQKRARLLVRRATEYIPPIHPRNITTRSVSMNNLGDKLTKEPIGLRLRRPTNRSDPRPPSSPSESPLVPSPSPRKTRARAKQIGNQKRVEFSTDSFPTLVSDTDTETEPDTDHQDAVERRVEPSPRRLRRRRPTTDSEGPNHSAAPRRGTRPLRKARFEGSMRESSSDENDEDEDEDEDATVHLGETDELFSGSCSPSPAPGPDEEVDELSDDVMDVDNQMSSSHRAPRSAVRRTRSSSRSYPAPPPLGKRARLPRPAQTYTPPSDEDRNDDEDECEVEPRVLRNGKIVGEVPGEDEDADEEVDQLDDDPDEQIEGNSSEDKEENGSDASDDGMDEEEDGIVEDEDLDLSRENLKTLLRRRREDLIKLCEANDIDADGTKNQLAHALLEWRDTNTDTRSSPTVSSSASTERPSSSHKPVPRRMGTAATTKHTTPVLLREAGVHHSTQPQTPPISKKGKDLENEDIELDLGSLGLVDKEIPPEEITKLEKIGSGGFKDVYIGKYRNRKVAISEFRGTLSTMDIKELKLLREFNHPNVVHFHGVSIPEDTRSTPVMIISELCPNGDLFDYIRNVPPPSLRRVLNLMLDIARGIEYLHLRTPSVIHRDCKSSNILITAKVTAKITDFGLAKVKQSTRSMVRSLVGTVNWQAPELWHAHPKYDHKVDVFSCAMVYWEILQWHHPKKTYPWEGMNEHAIYEAVGTKKLRPSMSGMRKQWCPEIVALIERMWTQDPHDRPSISQVVRDLEQITSSY